MGIVRHGTLVADTVATVSGDSSVGSVAVLNKDDTERIYIRADGTNPAVDGNDSYVVLPCSRRVLMVNADTITVKLISSGTPDYEVEFG